MNISEKREALQHKFIIMKEVKSFWFIFEVPTHKDF
jgi:hypothetical protein